MPFVRITIHAANVTEQERLLLARGATDIMSEQLHKQRGLTSVLVEAVARHGSWTLDALALDSAAQPTAFIEAYITENTNSADEIAAAIAGFDGLIGSVLDHPVDASYVVLHTVPAGHWGYGGKTQSARRLTKREAPSAPSAPATTGAIDYARAERRARRLRAAAWRAAMRRLWAGIRRLRTRLEAAAARSTGRPPATRPGCRTVQAGGDGA